MITFHSQASDSRILGADHGLPLAKVFQENGAKLNTILTQLYASKDEEGGWKKWMNSGENPGLIAEIKAYCASVKNQYDSLVILGIGGSSLGGFSLLKALLHPYWNDLSPADRGGFPKFYFLENVDSDQVAGLMDVLNPEKTLVNVITKSGTTAETMSAFMTFKAWLEKSLGAEKSASHIVATTDVKKGILREIANQEGYKTFEVPDDVGGRFSIFSAVGLLPAALCGISIEEILRGVNELDKVLQSPDLAHNPAAQNALIQYEMFKKGKTVSVFMPYSYRLAPISDWYVQLWAESLGKKENLQGQKVYVGPTPVRAVGVTDQHSQVQLFNEGPFDKIVTFIQVEAPQHTVTIPNAFPNSPDLGYLGGKTYQELLAAEFESTRSSLTRNGRPHVTLSIPLVDGYHVGQLLYFLEMQTAIAGALFEIDPFNQPGVELAKQYTYALMGRKGFEHLISEAKGESLTSSAVK